MYGAVSPQMSADPGERLGHVAARYCLPIYGSCTKRNLTRLQRVMNFGARVIAGRKKRDSVSDVLHDIR